jgi:glycosyltransferase involved in cell wall biosynthesis
MKVCIVSTHYPSDDAIGEYCGHMAAELSKNMEVIVLANAETKLPISLTIQTNNGNNSYSVQRVWKNGLFFPFQVFKGIIRNKPNLLHIQHEYFLFGKRYNAVLFPAVLLLSKMLRIPIVVTMHHVIPIGKAAYFKELLRTSIPEIFIKMFLIAFNQTFHLSSKILVPTLSFKNTLLTDYNFIDDNIKIIPHFTNCNVKRFVEADNGSAKTFLGLYGKKIILFYGYIRPTKGIEYAIYALLKVKETIPNVLLYINGKAQPQYEPYFTHLKKIVNDLGLSQYVRFDNNLPKEFYPVVFAASDVAVFPYVSTVGMAPIAHLTAAAYGTPIIVTSVDSFADELLDYENALIVPPMNADVLSKRIVEVFTNDQLSKKLSNNLSQYCAERSNERIIGGMVTIYQKLIAERRKRKLANEPIQKVFRKIL